jgi:hypothetical protein
MTSPPCHPSLSFLLALCLFLFRAFGQVSPEEDYGDEKDDYDDIFDAVGLEEIYILI